MDCSYCILIITGDAAESLEVYYPYFRIIEEGYEAVIYTACSLNVENLGAIYTKDTLHVDGNIVSGHAWPDLPGFMREFQN